MLSNWPRWLRFVCACLTGTNGTVCDVDVDDCTYFRNQNPVINVSGRSNCIDLGINLYDCKRLVGRSGVVCAISELNVHNTYLRSILHSIRLWMWVPRLFRIQIQRDLEPQFPDIYITVRVIKLEQNIAVGQRRQWPQFKLVSLVRLVLTFRLNQMWSIVDAALIATGYSGQVVFTTDTVRSSTLTLSLQILLPKAMLMICFKHVQKTQRHQVVFVSCHLSVVTQKSDTILTGLHSPQLAT
jgi:hypothetical protein